MAPQSGPQAGSLMPWPAWMPSSCRAPRLGRAPRTCPAAEGLTAVAALAATEKKAWLLFTPCVEKSL